MKSFLNKVVVITGGSDGIGKALVEAFLMAGARVATCSRNADKLYQLQSSYVGKPLFAYTADVSKEDDCKRFIEKVIKNYGSIDILINNAGISMRSLLVDVEVNTIRQVMDTNFWGTVFCTKFALPNILESKGTIVAVSSVAGYRGLPGRTGYSASKFAINGFMESLRTELLNTGVQVMWVCPGFTASNIRNVALDKDGKPQGESPLKENKLMSSEVCSQHIMNAILHKKRTIVLTTQGKETVFLNRFFPNLSDKLVHWFFFKKGKLVK